jgi:hypothetical protein
MANDSIDHMLSLTIFIAALLIFIGLFSQTIQTGISYQQHTAMSTKASDLLDTILLNPGIPDNWSRFDDLPSGLGLQDLGSGQYRLNPISPMRLTPVTEESVYYSRTDMYYNNLTAGYGSYLLTPSTQTINYTGVSKLLGVNSTYGFQLTLTPTITVDIEKISTGAPLRFSIETSGTGFVFANANITYSLILVNENAAEYPSYTIISGNSITNQVGEVPSLTFLGVDGESRSYALIVYSYLYGLKGMGYYVHVPQSFTDTIVPLVESFENRSITLAHGDSVGAAEPSMYSQLSYNATFAILTEEYTLRQVILEQTSAVGKVDCGPGSIKEYASVIVPDNAGILIVTYKDTSTSEYGVVLVPWGLGSMAYSVTFGGNSAGHDWVTTDIRQVTISGIAYHVKISLWNLERHAGST